jgi:hypothetical protein
MKLDTVGIMEVDLMWHLLPQMHNWMQGLLAGLTAFNIQGHITRGWIPQKDQSLEGHPNGGK